eukprot:Gregarina_sp_Pseudo_9__5608@NODE_769_length_2238_cov_44_051387_g724_i0_p3_GENE_NODE_769_length_2238_cov_44_051387_g724_i0NODE_769_length_2238_cov_44_051387_g724_i0_p3_ORF_typecomplete_len121_score3_84_NODE_769_length_2238_cov_44_051387_g724_i017312093
MCFVNHLVYPCFNVYNFPPHMHTHSHIADTLTLTSSIQTLASRPSRSLLPTARSLFFDSSALRNFSWRDVAAASLLFECERPIRLSVSLRLAFVFFRERGFLFTNSGPTFWWHDWLAVRF